MYLEFMTPELFDALVIASVVIGLAIAGRRFRLDLRKPLARGRAGMGRAAATNPRAQAPRAANLRPMRRFSRAKPPAAHGGLLNSTATRIYSRRDAYHA